MTDKEKITYNLEKIFKIIEDVCKKKSRDPSGLRVIAATKYADLAQVQMLYDSGLVDFGENKADELVYKSKNLKGSPVWHFIGHLQSNKIKKIVPIAEYIHSVESFDTLVKINKFAKSINKVQKILIEVNISGEETKYGLKLNDVKNFIMDGLKYDNIKICGLMTMGPLTDDFDYIRGIFRSLKILSDELNNSVKCLNLSELSMGMSNDFIIAVEEGATMLRIGSAIFK
ncbi:YggS family pyridoxal phosphate-dependent enzyme [bacterium]|nr:YggS family pyridoxal phosphate-dependent enzyme [bacterium]